MVVKGVLPYSSYFLWTQKGYTRLPLARGSCFVLGYDLSSAFYTRHIITSAPVAMPVKFANCFGNSDLVKGLGERHITSKILIPSGEVDYERSLAARKANNANNTDDYDIRKGRVLGDLNCNYKVDVFPTTTVGRLTLKSEASVAQCPPHISELFTPLTVDRTPIQPGDELIFVGYDMVEDRASPHDGHLTMRQLSIHGTSVAALKTNDFGTVVVCSTLTDAEGGAGVPEIPASMAGGAVLRKSTGGVVGTIAARTTLETPLPIEVQPTRSVGGSKVPYREPAVDLSAFPLNVREAVGPKGIAFTPIEEYFNALKRLE